jgi:NADPH-dependent 2,4-dienoyl-CoA reductase/sulfur reductase-like enzyme
MSGILIVGAGLAGQRCAETLRSGSYEAPIRMVGAENWTPYDRPPLSKALLAGAAIPGKLALRPAGWHRENGVELLLGRRAVRLDPVARRVSLEDGEVLAYERLLIATGAEPRSLPLAEGLAGAHVLRTLDDALALRRALVRAGRLAVIGAGFIGLEVAATARRLGVEVTVLEAAPTPLAAVLGQTLGGWLARMHREEGVEVLLNAQIEAIAGGGRAEEVVLSDGGRVVCDVLLVGVGVAPATGWLAGSALLGSGVPTDRFGRTGLPHVFAAGDAARPWDPAARVHARSEHWEAAARQGAAVARAMLALPPAPGAPPVFWSDQYGVRIQFAGRADGHDEVQIDGDPGARDFRALLLRRGHPVGGLLVGRPRALPELRRLLSGAGITPNERQAA